MLIGTHIEKFHRHSIEPFYLWAESATEPTKPLNPDIMKSVITFYDTLVIK